MKHTFLQGQVYPQGLCDPPQPPSSSIFFHLSTNEKGLSLRRKSDGAV